MEKMDWVIQVLVMKDDVNNYTEVVMYDNGDNGEGIQININQ